MIDDSIFFETKFYMNFFIILSLVFIGLFLLVLFLYFSYRDHIKRLELNRGKRVLLRDLNGNSLDIGKFVKIDFNEVPVICIEPESGSEDPVQWYMKVYGNNLNNAIINYGNEIMVLTDFETSDLKQHQVVCLLNKEILEYGLRHGITRIKQIIIPILNEVEELENIIDDLNENLLRTTKNSFVKNKIYLNKIEKSLVLLYDYLLRNAIAPSLLIKKRLSEVLQEKDGIKDEDMKSLVDMLEEKPKGSIFPDNSKLEEDKINKEGSEEDTTKETDKKEKEKSKEQKRKRVSKPRTFNHE